MSRRRRRATIAHRGASRKAAPPHAARSNSRLSENGPSGVSANSSGLHDGDARIDERRHLPLAAAVQTPARVHDEVAAAVVTEAGRQRRRPASACPYAPDSRPAATRRGFGAVPRSTNESELSTKNAPSPRSGSALFTPPPVSRSRSRSSEMTICGARRRAMCASIRSAKMVDVDHRGSHACVGQPVERVVDQRSAADLDERLRKGGRDRAHALAETGGEHHGGVTMGRTIFAHRRGQPEGSRYGSVRPQSARAAANASRTSREGRRERDDARLRAR